MNRTETQNFFAKNLSVNLSFARIRANDLSVIKYYFKVDAEGPLVRLKNLLFNQKTLLTIAEWVTVRKKRHSSIITVTFSLIRNIGL